MTLITSLNLLSTITADLEQNIYIGTHNLFLTTKSATVLIHPNIAAVQNVNKYV